jgi:hypothetical protein
MVCVCVCVCVYVRGCTTCVSNYYLCILPIECIYEFHMILGINSCCSLEMASRGISAFVM